METSGRNARTGQEYPVVKVGSTKTPRSQDVTWMSDMMTFTALDAFNSISLRRSVEEWALSMRCKEISKGGHQYERSVPFTPWKN